MAKKILRKKTSNTSQSEPITSEFSQESYFSKKKRSLIIGTIVVLGLLGLLYYYRGLFVVAIVNGEPISRLALVKDLEKQGGKQTLDSQITKVLILQEAKKKNILISQGEIDAELKKIDDSLKSQKQSLDAALLQRGMIKDELVDQIRMQKIIEKLAGKDIAVSDKEVADYIEQNRQALGQEQDEKKLQAQVKDQLKQQRLSGKFQTFLQNLQKNAKITYFVNY